MSRIKTLACRALASALDAQPALAGHVKAVRQRPDKLSTYPALCVMPGGRFDFTSGRDRDVVDSDGDSLTVTGDPTRAVLEVGQISGEVEIWAADKTAAGRELIEAAVLDQFMQEDTGVNCRIMTQLAALEVSGLATPANWTVAFLLGDTEWREEMVFSERRWSVLRAVVDLPILAARAHTALVQTLVLAITQDLASPLVAPGDLGSIDLEQYAIADDGTVTSP